MKMRAWILVLALCGTAVAEESLELTFKDGKKVTATVSGGDDETVTLGKGKTERKVKWTELAPESAFRARKSLSAYDDGAAHLVLAEFALSLRLYPQAQEELEVALALGALGEDAFEKRAAGLKEAEVDMLTSKVESCLEKGEEPTVTLGAIKQLKKRYPDHVINKAYEPLIKALVAQIEKSALEQQSNERQVADEAALKDLKKKLAKIRKKKDKELRKADELKAEGLEAAGKGIVSRVRKRLVEERQSAVAHYKKARTYLRRMRRMDPQFTVLDREKLRKEYDRIEKDIVACYLAAAEVYLDQRSYKRAVLYVYKVLLYDPINERALEMKAEIARNRIHFRVSDISNAKPRVSGG